MLELSQNEHEKAGLALSRLASCLNGPPDNNASPLGEITKLVKMSKQRQAQQALLSRYIHSNSKWDKKRSLVYSEALMDLTDKVVDITLSRYLQLDKSGSLPSPMDIDETPALPEKDTTLPSPQSSNDPASPRSTNAPGVQYRTWRRRASSVSLMFITNLSRAVARDREAAEKIATIGEETDSETSPPTPSSNTTRPSTAANSMLLSPLNSPQSNRTPVTMPNLSILPAEDELKLYQDVPIDETLAWRFFSALSNNRIPLSKEAYVALAKRFAERQETDKAIIVLMAAPKDVLGLEGYKFLIMLHLCKKPQDVEAAKKVLTEFEGVSQDKSYQAFDSPEDDYHALWLYHSSLVKDVKWTTCLERYEEAKANAEYHKHTFLDNAMIEVCLTHDQFDYGWKVYESIKEYDKYSYGLGITLCWKAFFDTLRSQMGDHDALSSWEAKAWAVFSRLQCADKEIVNLCIRYVCQRLTEIVQYSPDIDLRERKLERMRALAKESKYIGSIDVKSAARVE